jgi:hypothetical protein
VVTATRRGFDPLAAFALVSIVAGAALRFAWPDDIEWKHDERFMFERSQHVGVDEPWSMLGMPSGVGLRNAGLSIWIFVGLARVLHVTTPSGLAMAVAALGVVALATTYLFAQRIIVERERPAWLWAIALAAVSPTAIMIERKIWAQSVLPVFVVLFWLGWWRRDRVWGAFTWGVVGALLGQIHMSGVFFAVGVFAWEIASAWRARRRGEATSRPKWIAWLVGSTLGALPMLPWLVYLVHAHAKNESAFDAGELFTPRFWYFGATDALGVGLATTLGSPSFFEMLRSPWIGGVPTYGVGLVLEVLLGVGLALIGVTLRRAWISRRSAAAPVGSTGQALRAVWIGYGALITLSGALLYRHYLVITFPFEWIAVASMALAAGGRWTKVLPVLWGCQLVMTIAFLVYVHVHHGALGDYGIGLRWQTAADTNHAPYE